MENPLCKGDKMRTLKVFYCSGPKSYCLLKALSRYTLKQWLKRNEPDMKIEREATEEDIKTYFKNSGFTEIEEIN